MGVLSQLIEWISGLELATYGYKLAISALIFLAFVAISTMLRKALTRIGERMDSEKRNTIQLIGNGLYTVILILGGITALGTLGMDISALIAGLGLTGFAMGFALKDALSNFLAGALILLYQPFEYDDRIVVAGIEGAVVKIDLRYTVLQAADKKFLIPNALLFTNTITVKSEGVTSALFQADRPGGPEKVGAGVV